MGEDVTGNGQEKRKSDGEGLDVLADLVHKFVADREWCKGHNPKNLAMAIGVEVGELLEIFQWLSISESAGVRFDDELRSSVGCGSSA